MIGWRKYSLPVGVIVIATALIMLGKLTGSEYVQLITWVTGLYFGANATQAIGVKVAEAKSSTVQATATGDTATVEVSS